jgi:hypothetical protein
MNLSTLVAHLSRLLIASLVLLGMATSPAAAQELRYVTGGFVDYWNRYDPPGLTTTVTTVGGRQCGPNQTSMDPCQGNPYPFVGGQNVAPVRPTGAIQQAGLGTGEPVNFPLASEWTRMTSGTIPGGVIPGVLSIWTIYDGRNAVALPASGKGLAAGAGPGNFNFNPLASGVPGSSMFQTLSWPSGMDPGQTTTIGNAVSTNFPAMTAQPISKFGAIYTAGPNQFGGTAAVLTDTPNRLTLQFPATVFVRTNGKCRRNAQINAGLTVTVPFGDCQVGFWYGTDHVATSVRRHVSQTASVNPVVLGQHGYWGGNLWTTGTITVRNFIDAGSSKVSESFALSGTDTITTSGARHLVLVSPVMNYDKGLFGDQGGGAHIGVWDMMIQTPEPTAALGLVAGLGLLGGLHVRARRRRREG